MSPNASSYCEIDPATVDQWGIPVLRFHFRWTEHEIKQVRHMHDTFTAIIETMGGRANARKFPDRGADAVSIGGEIIHEAGTGGIHGGPKHSTLNRRAHGQEVKKQFVADAAPFLGNPG